MLATKFPPPDHKIMSTASPFSSDKYVIATPFSL